MFFFCELLEERRAWFERRRAFVFLSIGEKAAEGNVFIDRWFGVGRGDSFGEVEKRE